MAPEMTFRMSIRSATTLVFAAMVLLVVAAFALYPRVLDNARAAAQDEAQSTLRLVSDAVDQAIGRYQPLPELIARDPTLVALLTSDFPSGIVPFANEKLRQTALSVDASEVYVMNATGLTVAASNYRAKDSFLGKNFAFRPYFQDAIAGDATQYHALGTTSGERGFFFSAPILDGIEVMGVLALKVTVEDFEGAWEGASREIIVSDPNGIAFLSSQAAYRMRALAPLPDAVLQEVERTRQFPLSMITPLPFSASVLAPGSVEVTVGEGQGATRYLSDSRPLALGGWHAIVLTPAQPIQAEALRAVVLRTLAALGIVMAALVVIQRRARTLERIRFEQTQRDVLEKRVKERTADLDAANASLRDEVEVRRAAEDKLRKTQKDLVQAGKLAALGQMSAALSHEINQPLAAVKSYADNAKAYLDRDRMGEARDNITRISDMTDRMARISGHLRNFARQPGESLNPVPVADVVREAIALVEPQMRQGQAEVVFNDLIEDAFGLGGRLRLQQVVVNILTNAFDAMSDSPLKRVEVSMAVSDTTVAIHLRDHGPGLSEEAMDQVFEAFFTTKRAGAGMGLGLSISSNIIRDFGGTLAAANHPDGGCVFTVTLKRAEGQTPQPMVAE